MLSQFIIKLNGENFNLFEFDLLQVFLFNSGHNIHIQNDFGEENNFEPILLLLFRKIIFLIKDFLKKDRTTKASCLHLSLWDFATGVKFDQYPSTKNKKIYYYGYDYDKKTFFKSSCIAPYVLNVIFYSRCSVNNIELESNLFSII